MPEEIPEQETINTGDTVATPDAIDDEVDENDDNEDVRGEEAEEASDSPLEEMADSTMESRDIPVTVTPDVGTDVQPEIEETALSPPSDEEVTSTVGQDTPGTAVDGNGQEAPNDEPLAPIDRPDTPIPSMSSITPASAPASPPRYTSYARYGSPPPPSSVNGPPRGCLSRLEPIISILTYPIMVLVTVIMLIMVITFCIFPTLLCMMLGICLYYCLREDPIPLSVLLRYMLSPDADDHPEYPNSYALAQRPVIASKLIVRRVLKIEDITSNDEKLTKDEDYPRRHPLPIKLRTDHKCLHFSEPVTIEENESSGANSNIGDTQEDGLVSSNTRIPHYQRTEEEPFHPTTSLVGGVPNPMNMEAANNDGDAGSNDGGDVELGIIKRTFAVTGEDIAMLQEEEIILCEDSKDFSNGREALESELENSVFGKEMIPSNPAAGTSREDIESGAEADYFGIHADVRDRGTTCDICLLEYQVGETVAWSPNVECSHAFHRDCILDWLVRKPSCPNCRVDYLKGKQDDAF